MIIPQRAFSSGELSPSLYARTDYFRYSTGAKIIRNAFVKKAGGIDNRGGTEFVAEVGSNSELARFIPFIFNSVQTYNLEFQDSVMRVHKNGSLVTLSPQVITSITAANPAVLNYGGADNFPDGTSLKIYGIDSNLAPAGKYYNNRIFKSDNENTAANTISLKYNDGDDVDSSGFGAAVGTDGLVAAVYELATTYTEDELADLKYSQSGDKIFLVHPSHPPRELTRISDNNWTIADIVFAPSQVAPDHASVAISGTPGTTHYSYVVTAVNDTTSEESLPSAVGTTIAGAATLNDTNKTVVTYPLVTGATYYNIYKLRNGVYGFIGTSSGGTFADIGYSANTSDSPPTARTPFATAGNYPSCVAFYQQRCSYGNTNNNSELVEMSQTSAFKNFTKSIPIRDSDVVSFSLTGSQVSSIKHLLDLGNLVLFTDSGEKVAAGDSSGVITPNQINVKQYSYNGIANNPAPIVIDNSAIYVQASGSVIRDFAADITVDGYRGNDLTNFSDHLFRGRVIVDMCYQKLPDSIVWAVRDDGQLLSLTYIKEQQMLAWTHHDFQDGFVENVSCVPNGSKYDVYILVRRVINGVTKRYCEKIYNRQIAPRAPVSVRTIIDSVSSDFVIYRNNVDQNVFCDSALTYDGNNTDLTNQLGLSTDQGTGGYTADDIVKINTTIDTFDQFDVGNEIHVRSGGVTYRIELLTYIDPTNFLGRPEKTLPADICEGSTTSDWAKAVDDIEGLWHIEGEDASISGDGYVVASPNNPAFTVITVTNGSVHLPSCYAVIHVGLPYVSDIETLSLDTPTPNTSVDKKALVKTVTLQIENTRGVWVGSRNPDEVEKNEDGELLFQLNEIKQRAFENYDSGVDLLKGKMEMNVQSAWDNNARVFIRQVDPLPMTILSISPEGILPFK